MKIFQFRKFKSLFLVLIFSVAIIYFENSLLVSEILAQTSSKELLKKGIELYNDLEFEKAQTILLEAIKKGLPGRKDAIEAHKYLAFCYAILGQANQARAAFLHILEIDVQFELPITESPKLRTPFDEAKKEFLARDVQPPAVQFAPPDYFLENSDLRLQAIVTDVSGVDSVLAFFKTASAKQFSRMVMQRTEGDLFVVSIPANELKAEEIELYLLAIDRKGQSIQTPKPPQRTPVRIVDTEPPIIVHTPINEAMEDSEIVITAQITDRSGVQKAELLYRKTGETRFLQSEMTVINDNLFSAKMPAAQVTRTGLEYYIKANDKAGNPTAFSGDVKKPYVINITKTDTESPVIVHTPISEANANTKITLTASITDQTGVSTATLFYRPKGTAKYASRQMEKKRGDVYETTIETGELDLEYYLQALDEAGNPPALYKSSISPQIIIIKKLAPVIVQKTPSPAKKEAAMLFVPYDEAPQPIGGFKAIQSKLEYPVAARKAGIEGQVTVSAYINENGDVIETKILVPLGNHGCNEAAVAAIKSVKWRPAKQKDKPIAVWVLIPVSFNLK